MAGSVGRASRWDATERAAFLAEVRLFRDLPAEVLADVAARFRVELAPPGQFVLLEGQQARSLNLLASGRIKMIRESADGREVIIRLIRPGEIFGGAGGWGEAVYPASAVVQREAVILRLPAEEFTALIRAWPDFALAVVRELGTRLREATERIQDLQSERVEQRLARALLRQAAREPARAEGGLVVSLSRQDLAELAGTTLSTASRTISDWARRGLVAAGRQRVSLLDPAGLAELAEES